MECNAKWRKTMWKLIKWLRVKKLGNAGNTVMTMQDEMSQVIISESIVYSPAARKSVNSVIRMNNQGDSYKYERPVKSGMVSAPPFGGSHPAPKWED